MSATTNNTTYRITGTVRDTFQRPLAGATVIAVDRDIRSEQELGRKDTDAKGKYTIEYTHEQFARGDKKAADILIRVYSNTQGQPDKTTDILFNAPAEVTIDIALGTVAYQGPSELENLEAAIHPFIEGLPLSQLTENDKTTDVSFLVSKTGQPLSSIMLLVMAARFEDWTRIELAVFYGIFRQQVPSTIQTQTTDPTTIDTLAISTYTALLTTDEDTLIAALNQAADTNIIPYWVLANLTTIQQQLGQLLLSPPQIPGTTTALPAVYSTLDLTTLTQQQRQSFLQLYRTTGSRPALWQQLAQDPLFKGSAALDQTQAIFQVSDLTGGNAALLTAVVNQYKIDSTASLMQLAAVDTAGWATIIKAAGTQGDATAIDAQAQQIAANVERLLPTPVFAARLASDKSSLLPAATITLLSQFFKANPDFDFTNTHINIYLKQAKQPPANAADLTTLSNQIMKIQRVYKIAPSYDAVNALLKDDVHSSLQVYRMGRSNFSNKYAATLGKAAAADTFNKATQQYASATHLAATLHSMVKTPTIRALPNFNANDAWSKSSAVQAYPNLENLFGIADLCECCDCHSFLSADAYVTDLLEWLGQRLTNNVTARATLFTRRGDLGDVDLNCANAEVLLPYIDLVLELLEDYIIPPIALLNDPTLIPYLTAGVIQTPLLNAILAITTLPKNPICNITLLTAAATVSAEFQTDELPLDQWIVRDKYITLKLIAAYDQTRNAAGKPGNKFLGLIVKEIHETHLTATEIAVNPEYTNTNVYDCLRNPWNTDNINSWILYPNRIPFTLPFDLYFTEANAYLVRLGIQRYELIRSFRPQPPAAPAPDPTWYPVACAYLNMSSGSAASVDKIIFVPQTAMATQKKFWGAAVMAQYQTPELDLFLNSVSLSFKQLEQLLALSFLNPTTDPANPVSTILYTSTDCDLTQMQISNMTLVKYDAFNRFLRLWNLLVVSTTGGFAMDLLNACIMAKGVGEGQLDAVVFPVRLYYLLQLSKQLNLTDWSLLAFYNNIATDGNNSLYKQLFQNRAINNPLIANLDLKVLTANAALPNPPAIADALNNPGVLPVVLTACQLSSDDFTFLVTTYPACAGLTLANLSFLYRSGILASSLGISVEDLYTFITLTAIYPFTIDFPGTTQTAATSDTASFVEKFNAIKKAGFAVDDLNYVLAHQSTAVPSLVADNATIATALTTLRSALQTAATATTVQPDPQGTLLAKWLADPLLGWPPAVAARLISILTSTSDANYAELLSANWLMLKLLHLSYEAASNAAYLAQLPTLVFPSVSDLSSISYDANPGFLTLDYTGRMNGAAYLALRAQSDDFVYQNAVDQLFYISQTPQPANTSYVKILNPNIPFANIDVSVLGYNTATQTLSYNKQMSTQTQSALLALSADTAYQNAINFLYTQSQTQVNNSTVVPLPSIAFPTLLSTQISYNATLKSLNFGGYMDANTENMLLTLSTDAAYQTAVGTLFTAAQLTDNSAANDFPATLYMDLQALPAAQEAARFAYFLNAIAPVYKQLKLTDTLTRQLSQLLPAGLSTVAGIMGQLPAIYIDFTADSFENSVQDIYHNTGNPNFPVQVNWLLTLRRLAFTTAKFSTSAADVAWLLQYYDSYNSVQFQALPGTKDSLGNIIPPQPFSAWAVLNALAILTKSYKPQQVPQAGDNNESVTLSITSVLTEWIALPFQQYPSDLLTLTALTKADLDALIVSLNMTGLPAAQAPALLVRLSQCFKQAAQLKISTGKCVSWTTDPISNATAQDIRQVLKSSYPDAAQWTAAIQPVANALRESRRDALIAYLLANDAKFTDQEAAYSYFLIYIEMGACQPTARIVQAYCSIQLFVQRCFLGLELPAVLVNASEPLQPNYDVDWQQWSFMQRYEYWRRNRAIFLYPENYLRPDLLPDASSLYQDMLNNLGQNQVTENIAESAYMTYLLGLDNIARLEVRGQWYDELSNTLHVFARNFGGDPRTWCYRTLPTNGVWTAWEAINLEITGDTIVPVVNNGRIYLFWPVFTKKSLSQLSPNMTTKTKTLPPSNYWQIQMASSEYQNGVWSPKKVSSQNEDESILFPAPELFVFNFPDHHGHPHINDYLIELPDQDAFTFVAIDNQFLELAYQGGTTAQKLQSLQGTGQKDLGFSIVCFYAAAAPSLYEPFYLYGPQGTAQLTALMTEITVSSGKTQPVPALPVHLQYQQLNAYRLDPCRPVLKAYQLILPALDNMKWPLFIQSTFEGNVQEVSLDKLDIANTQNLVTDSDSLEMPVSLQMDYWDKLTYAAGILDNVAAPQIGLGTFMPFFFMDDSRTYYVAQEYIAPDGTEYNYPGLKALSQSASSVDKSEAAGVYNNYLKYADPLYAPAYRFYNFYHPLACTLVRTLYSGGIDALFTRAVQLQGDPIFQAESDFATALSPTPLIVTGPSKTWWTGNTDPTTEYPKATLDFTTGSGYDNYNWEWAVYSVMLVSMQLTQNQQFQDADHWLNYIFNPTDTSAYPAPQKYWITKPFFSLASDSTTMAQLITQLDLGTVTQGFINQVISYKQDPFDPFPIAQSRLTPLMKKAVMMKLDNLIAWANFNYQQDTMESVNLAIQYYMLALELLGPKPQPIPSPYQPPVLNYNQIEQNLDNVIANLGAGNADGSVNDPLVIVENLLPAAASTSTQYGVVPRIPTILYFCIPQNSQLSGYWDTIEQQLYKISHCLNINGQFSPLSPFPDLNLNGDEDDIDDLDGIIPNYRFSTMVQKATELCNEVKALGSSLLAALEKQDAEVLALLRSSTEIGALQFVTQIKSKQIDEAQSQLDNVNNYQLLVQKKINYYNGLLQAGLNTWEANALAMNTISNTINISIQSGHYLAGIISLIPDFNLGVAGVASTPTSTLTLGGKAFAAASKEVTNALATLAGTLDKMASIATTIGTYTRRSQEWQFQYDLASQELEQAKNQVAAATTRLAIANLESKNQDLLIANAQEIDSFLRYQKYTNQQLYAWMVTQLSNIYFQSYQLAYQTAKLAERCFRYELGIAESSYISFGYWDSLKKGLLSGDQLMYAIRRMETDYLSLNTREKEVAGFFSMAQFDAAALLSLRTTGACFFNITEAMMDKDYAGQYFRRIKSMSITIPAVAGPFTSVNARVTLVKNSVRTSNTVGNTYSRRVSSTGMPMDDPRFSDNVGMVETISAAHCLNDAGVFELNLRDERYNFFEFAGAISTWYIELPQAIRQFDYTTISDLIVNLKYTAREGGAQLETAAGQDIIDELTTMVTSSDFPGLMATFSLRRDFPTEWYQFLHPVNPALGQVLSIQIPAERFPFYIQSMIKSGMQKIKIDTIELVTAAGASNTLQGSTIDFSGQNNLAVTKENGMPYSPLLGSIYVTPNVDPGLLTMTVPAGIPGAPLKASDLGDIQLILHYVIA